MSDWWFSRPIRPPDRTEQEQIKVPPIEEEKRIKEKYEQNQQKAFQSKTYFYAGLLMEFKKRLNELKEKQGSNISLSQRKSVVRFLLKKIRDSLLEMQEHDQSSNQEFIQNLSDTWIDFCGEIEMIESHLLQKEFPFREIHDFKNSLSDFPPNQEHSLGFYLIHHAGRDWLPFPFMEILKEIHREYLNDELQSHLIHWAAKIDKILEQL